MYKMLLSKNSPTITHSIQNRPIDPSKVNFGVDRSSFDYRLFHGSGYFLERLGGLETSE
jgi:hypothetical protein